MSNDAERMSVGATWALLLLLALIGLIILLAALDWLDAYRQGYNTDVWQQIQPYLRAA